MSNAVSRVAARYQKKAKEVKGGKVWVELAGASNISVKRYESPDLGNSAIQGTFQVWGDFHIQLEGYSWSSSIPFNVTMEVSEHDQSGTLSIHSANTQRTKDGEAIARLLPSLLDYRQENFIVAKLRAPFVPYVD